MPRMVDRKADAACGCIGFLGVYKVYKIEVSGVKHELYKTSNNGCFSENS